MDHLTEITLEELQQALEEVEGKRETQRLLAAIAYKNGISQTELATWYGVPRKTIYNWLVRLEERPLHEAVRDKPKPGRSRKLTSSEQKELEVALRESPGAVGLDEPAWHPTLLQQYLQDEYDVSYSVPSCRRLMKEAGLSYQRSGRQTVGEGPTDSERVAAAAGEERRGYWVP